MEGEAHHLSYAYTKPCRRALQPAASTPMACTATHAAPCSAEGQVTPTTSANGVMLLSLVLYWDRRLLLREFATSITGGSDPYVPHDGGLGQYKVLQGLPVPRKNMRQMPWQPSGLQKTFEQSHGEDDWRVCGSISRA